MNKILYYAGLVFEIVFLIMVIFLLPIILSSNWQGFLMLILIIFLIVSRLYILFKNNNLVKKSKSYNILMIGLTIYFSIVAIKIGLVSSNQTLVYGLSKMYCQNNFLIISISIFCIIINNSLLIFTNKEDTLV